MEEFPAPHRIAETSDRQQVDDLLSNIIDKTMLYSGNVRKREN